MSATIPAILQRAKLPDLVAAVYGNGRHEARLRATHEVLATGADLIELNEKLKELYPEGYALDIRYDPHM